MPILAMEEIDLELSVGIKEICKKYVLGEMWIRRVKYSIFQTTIRAIHYLSSVWRHMFSFIIDIFYSVYWGFNTRLDVYLYVGSARVISIQHPPFPNTIKFLSKQPKLISMIFWWNCCQFFINTWLPVTPLKSTSSHKVISGWIFYPFFSVL